MTAAVRFPLSTNGVRARAAAPYGMLQCTECTPFSLRGTGRTHLPFSGCVSALAFTEASARIVRIHKDGGERRLAAEMAYATACVIPPEWITSEACVTFVPATRAAVRRRGFDHGRDVAKLTADLIGLPCRALLGRPHTKDQRTLDRTERFANMTGGFHATCSAAGIAAVLIDDVYTTGATLCAATDALLEAGAARVYCATFTHVY